ncbi:hypothetical protein ACWGM0_19185 (plasmid) [Sphingomonas bisphenolicum]
MMELDLNSIPSDFEGRRQHALNKIQDHIEPGAHAGRFLDIGCGSGNGVIAALQAGFKAAVGIDRSLQDFLGSALKNSITFAKSMILMLHDH